MADLAAFWKEVESLLDPLPVQAPIYRLYYEPESGKLLFYSMDDLPGTYIEVDRDTFHGSDLNVRVRDGRLIHTKHAMVSRLMPSDQGASCHPNDVTVIVPTHHPHQKWSKQYDQT